MQFQKKSFIKVLLRSRRGGAGAIILMILAGIALVGACYYASTLKGSREMTNDYYADVVDGDKAQQCLRDSESLESKFNSIHEFKKGSITNEEIDIYDKAIISYEKYLMYSGIDKRVNPRADKMRRKLHNMRAEKIRDVTAVLEGDAEKLAEQKKYAEAEKLFAQAVAQEQRINTQFALAEKKNHARTIHLQNRVLSMQAIPLVAKANLLEKEGVEAIEAENWARANLKFREALKIQQLLWTDYRNVISAGMNRIAVLNVLIETTNSAVDYEEEKRLVKLAEEAEAKGDYAQAEKHWAAALERQTLLCKNFPRSQFANEKKTKELEQRMANAGAKPQFNELKELLKKIEDRVRSRKLEEVPILARRATVIASKIIENYPTASLVSKELMRNLQYLDVKSRDIDSIQTAFFGALASIPGVPAENVQMMKKEVSQAFFTFVMGMNPSADTTRSLSPVESVNYEDTQEFCRRFSLLVGFEVRLPTEDEFNAAVGNLKDSEISEQAWTLENSGGKIHITGTLKPNPNGFFDLYGNVSEWVQQPKSFEKTEGCVLGGDCQFPVAMLVKENRQKTLLSDRSRLRGFRVLIDLKKPVELLSE